MKKVVRLNESDIEKLVKKIINEYGSTYSQEELEHMRKNMVPTEEDLESELNNILGEYTRKGMSDQDIHDVLKSWTENYEARTIRGRKQPKSLY
jgi:uncharacterized protein YpuA (DUF1002 family)